MKPICQFGFPCVHELYDDGGDPFCGYPFSKVDLPKTEEDMEKMSSGLLCDFWYDDCPINENVSISKHIKKMLDGLCWWCGGSGETYSLDGRKDLLLCDRSFIWTTCPECGGDGLKTKDQIRREEEAVNALNQRTAEKNVLMRTDCDYCVHAWIKRSTRWEPEDSGCDLEHEMTQDECDLAEVGKCPYFSVIEEA